MTMDVNNDDNINTGDCVKTLQDHLKRNFKHRGASYGG